jgi:hypothetical protein
MKHKNKFKWPLIHTTTAHQLRHLQIKIKEKSITENKPDISNCDASRRFLLFTGVIATVLWWTRWQLHVCKNGDRCVGRWHYVQEQRWPKDRPPGTKRARGAYSLIMEAASSFESRSICTRLQVYHDKRQPSLFFLSFS